MGNPVGFNAITVPSTWEMAGNELKSERYAACKGVPSPSICMSSSDNSAGVPMGEEQECEMKFNSSLCPLNYTSRIKCRIRDHKKNVLLKRIEF